MTLPPVALKIRVPPVSPPRLELRHGSRGNDPGLKLVPPLQPHHSPLALWHLLSLDAPTVAALWTLFLAYSAHLTLPWTAPAAMFLAVWMLYAADRLLDARLLDARPLLNGAAPPGLEARHRFHHAHRSRFLAAITLTACALALLLHRLDPHVLRLYALLATLLAAWLLLIHACNSPAHRLPKELAVGLFFPAAVFIPTVARAPWLRLSLLPTAALFAIVCTLNCLFLYAWEHPNPNSATLPSAHVTTLWATRHLTALARLAIALAILAIILYRAHPNPATSFLWLPSLACALSITLLTTLHALRLHLSPIHLRASADLALLTPLLLLPNLLH
jgi:hypothetical protein